MKNIDDITFKDIELGRHDPDDGTLPGISMDTTSSTGIQKKHSEKEVKEQQEPSEGGYGWAVVFSAFLIQFTVFGNGTTWGVYQEYYSNTIFSNVPVVQLSLVGSLAFLFNQLLGPFVTPIVARWGVRPVLIVGSILSSAGLILAGSSTEVWHLYLTQGFMFGVGNCLTYITTQPIPAQWFVKRRSTAMGLAASGSGIGGLVVSPLVSALINKVGIAWCYRIIGIITLVLSMIAALLCKAKVPPKASTKIVEWSLFKNPSYLLWIAGSMCSIFGYLVPFFYLPTYAQSINISASTASVLIGAISAINAVGRIIIGMAADRFGRVNTFLFSAFVTGLSCAVIWVFATNLAVLLVFSIVYGLFCGFFFTLVAPITAEIVGMEKLATAIGVLFCVDSVAVFGPSIAGAIQADVNPESFLAIILWAGFAFLGCFTFVAVIRVRITKGKLWARV